MASSDVVAYPDTKPYPLLATGIAPLYNVPSLPVGQQLVFRTVTMAKIFCGQVRYWNDSAIQADNPTVTLPYMPIRVVYFSKPTGANNLFSAAMSNAYPPFKSIIGSMHAHMNITLR